MHLARMESRVALNTLFDRLGPFALDPGRPPPTSRGWRSGRPCRCRWSSLRVDVFAVWRDSVSRVIGARRARCRTQQPSWASGRRSSPSRSTAPNPSWRPKPWSPRWPTPASSPGEVDGLSSYTLETTDEVTLAKAIGAGDVTYFSQVGYGGGAGCATIGHAAMAIATGQADVVVAWRSRKRGSAGRAALGGGTHGAGHPRAVDPSCGLLRPVDEVAMLTRRYMYEYGATREHLAEVAMADTGPCQPQSGRLDARQDDDARRLHVGATSSPSRSASSTTASRRTAPWPPFWSRRTRAKDCPHPPGSGACIRSGPEPPARDDGELLLRRPADGPGLGLCHEAVVTLRARAPRTSTWCRSTTPSPR